MELKDRKILVVGLGKTGRCTIDFLLSKGARVRASDSSPAAKIRNIVTDLESRGVAVETEAHTDDTFLWADIIVLSPGVPFCVPQIRRAMSEGINVISEIELAYRFITTPIIAITGSNGKTTTSTLIAKILERSGKKVFLGANIGTPLISIAEHSERYDILVLELSSFQLQGITTFRPYIALVLNISPNHLDHHESFKEYADSKMKICSNQTREDWFVYNFEDKVIKNYLPEISSQKVPFGNDVSADGVSFNGREIIFREHRFDVSCCKLLGIHNIENIMAAIAGTVLLGSDPERVQEEIDAFEPLEHRNEYIGELSGAKVYNDSKSTSPAATARALESIPSPIILIAGGKDKGVSFEPLRKLVKEKVKLMVLIGEAKNRMKDELGQGVPSELADSLEQALDITSRHIEPEDSVLFSPACSSFDMFNSYEHRGMKFKEIVENL